MRRRDPLGQLGLFSGCTPAQVDRVRSLLTMLRVQPGTVLMGQGTFGFEFLIIAEGEALVTVQTPDGVRTLATLGTVDFAGEMSLLAGSRRSATVTALTPLTFYVCNVAEFAGILDIAPSVGQRIALTAAAREQANRRLAA
jgi:CRP-like cAMP-binding protein